MRRNTPLITLLTGSVQGGKLVMTGKNRAQLTASHGQKGATGDVVAHGTHYRFSVPLAQKPSGLYQATAVVRGAKIKAGWIVLADGYQVGSLEDNANSSSPSATQAPTLDLATDTAVYNGVVLHATLVSGVAGSGF
jgi:serine/threonine-protein kinase